MGLKIGKGGGTVADVKTTDRRPGTWFETVGQGAEARAVLAGPGRAGATLGR